MWSEAKCLKTGAILYQCAEKVVETLEDLWIDTRTLLSTLEISSKPSKASEQTQIVCPVSVVGAEDQCSASAPGEKVSRMLF